MVDLLGCQASGGLPDMVVRRLRHTGVLVSLWMVIQHVGAGGDELPPSL